MTTTTTAAAKPGRLRYIGIRPYGWGERYAFYECAECKTLYRGADRHGMAHCNGVVIAACPWCRPDSTPWRWGRGS